MALPNRSGRKNAGNFCSMCSRSANGSRLNTQNRTLNTSMSRGSFLRAAGAVVGGAAAGAIGFGGAAHAGQAPGDYVAPEYVAGGGMNYNVWPTGNPAADVQNVQFCVDNVRAGGKVQLKSVDKFTGMPKAFDFGVGQGVNIKKDVKIIGETDLNDKGELLHDGTYLFPNGTPLTKVIGGLLPFYNEAKDGYYVPFEGPEITIQGIHFTQSNVNPIAIQYCKNATITGNKIDYIKPVPLPGTNYAVGGGIYVGTWTHLDIGSPGLQVGGAIGNITVTNNLVDCLTDTPVKDAIIGIMFIGTTNITGHISHNKVINVARNGVESIDNINAVTDEYPGGFSSHVTIEYNTVISDTVGNDFYGTVSPNCIVTGMSQYPYQESTEYFVLNNKIDMNGTNLSQFGILAMANKATIENNEIFMPGQSYGGLGIGLLGASNCEVRHNTLKTELNGTGFPAGLGVYLGPFANNYPPYFFPCTGNLIENNTFDAPPIWYPIPQPPYYAQISFMAYIDKPLWGTDCQVYNNTFSGVNNQMPGVLYGIVSCQEAVRGCTQLGCPGMDLKNTYVFPFGVGPGCF
ncbi:hypothetical protein L0Y65_03575 [Candidatus Micrarchaeota archaeon]|nr:hypothetical protein [Candidatus Micrarchaeota archaeon]